MWEFEKKIKYLIWALPNRDASRPYGLSQKLFWFPVASIA